MHSSKKSLGMLFTTYCITKKIQEKETEVEKLLRKKANDLADKKAKE